MSLFHIVLVSPSRPEPSAESWVQLMEEQGFSLMLGTIEDPRMDEQTATFHPVFQDEIEPLSLEHLEVADLVILSADLSPLALTSFYVGYAFGQDVPMVVYDPQNLLCDVLPNLSKRVLGTCRRSSDLAEVIKACSEAVGSRDHSDWMSTHYPRMLALIRHACKGENGNESKCERDA